MRRMRIRWPKYGSAVRVRLADDLNPELVDEVWRHLPFTCVQDHGVVSGKIMYCWAPMVSVADVHRLDLHSESPIGRVSYSQGTGNKIIVKYGEVTEDIGAPVLGLVPEEDHPSLERMGRQAWEATYSTKEIFEVVFEKEGE